MAVMARWWQLETWLRDLLYVEMRANYGQSWVGRLPNVVNRRQLDDGSSAGYMLTSDAHHILAYMDVTPLFELIEKEWDIVSYALLPKKTWAGRNEELRVIRNRMSHCRRPHADDLSKVEQALRDLEHGAFKAVSAFNAESYPDQDLDDPVVAAWIRREHAGAARLIDHCDAQYEIRMRLRYSKRPWAELPRPGEPITGREGYVWHAHWYLGRGYLNIRSFWSEMTEALRNQLLFACAATPAAVEISIPAVDDGAATADVLERFFDLVVVNQEPDPPPFRESLDRGDWWVDFADGLDPRVAVNSPWSVIDETVAPVTIFGA